MASQYIARLGIVLGVDSAELQRGVDEAAKKFGRFAAQAKSDSNMAAKALLELKNETEAYGKTLTKVEQIEQQIKRGRFQLATDDLKKQLLAEAAAYDAKANAMRKVSGVMTDQQKLQMSYQMTDLATQIASGQNPMIALIQQGGQLKDSMGGLGNMFKAIGSFITPFNVGITAAAASVGALGYALYSAQKELNDFKDSMTLTGQYAGIAYDQYLNMGKGLADATKATIGSSRDVLSAVVSSGQFTKDSIESVSKVILKFASISGQSAQDAANSLIPSLDGTANSAKKLNDRFHFLTIEQYRHIEALEKQGKMQEAAKLTADALSDSFDKTKRNLGTLEKAWKSVKDMASATWDAMLGIGREDGGKRAQDLEVKINQLTTWLEKRKSQFPSGNFQKEEAKLESMRSELNSIVGRVAAEMDAAEAAAKKADEESKKINLWSKAGGDAGRKKLAAEAAKLEMDAYYDKKMALADDAQRIEIELEKKIAQAKLEERERNENTFGQFSADSARIRAAKVEKAEADAEKDRVELRKKLFTKELDAEIQALKNKEAFQSEIDKKNIAAQEALFQQNEAGFAAAELEKDKLQLKMAMLGATEKEVQLAELKLQTEKDIALWKKSEQYKNLSESDQNFYEEQKRKVMDAKANNIALADSLKYVQGMYDAVWSNMSSAIDKFVRTGKGSMKDFTKSVVQDMLAMNMKLQAMAMLRQIMGFFRPFGGATAAGYMAGTTVGVSSGVNYSLGGSLTGRAVGGPVSSGTPYMIGEKGPELFVPSGSGTIIPNNQLGMGSTTNVTNNYINAIDAKSFEQRLLESNQAIWAANQYAGKNLATNYGRT